MRPPFQYDGVSLNVEADPIGDEVYRWMAREWYERQEATLVRRYLPPDVDVVELGAGIGYVSCIIDGVLHDDRTHLAVEPHPAVSSVLEETRALNDAAYIVCEAAYSASPGVVRLDLGHEYWNTRARSGPDAVTVQAVNLRLLCDRYALDEFSLVMDIEGSEYELLLSELDLLEARCPFLIVEFHSDGRCAPSYRNELRDSAFELIDGLETVFVYRNTGFVPDSSDSVST